MVHSNHPGNVAKTNRLLKTRMNILRGNSVLWVYVHVGGEGGGGLQKCTLFVWGRGNINMLMESGVKNHDPVIL